MSNDSLLPPPPLLPHCCLLQLSRDLDVCLTDALSVLRDVVDEFLESESRELLFLDFKSESLDVLRLLRDRLKMQEELHCECCCFESDID